MDEYQDKRFSSLPIDGANYKTHLTKKFTERKAWEPKNTNMITAAIPGTIFKISVKPGQKVTVGKYLFTLEAMKMKNRFLSPKAGTIKTIHMHEGDIVTKNQLLIELVEDSPPAKKPRTKSRNKK